ncbi:hypothetical protein B0G77_6328 [Paraburkholderia sp. BL10I2N1]|nr:hypothetical protein B0G77_6328 [Paraburkholderia sp. BL10I2N1]
MQSRALLAGVLNHLSVAEIPSQNYDKPKGESIREPKDRPVDASILGTCADPATRKAARIDCYIEKVSIFGTNSR